jgi:uncharacterized protein (DUF1501 family)
MENNPINRRKFLGQASCATIGSTSLFSTLSNFLFTNAAAAQNTASFNDYKALVCFFMPGGNDSFNLLVPTGAAYSEYATTRADLAVPQAGLLPINPINNAGRPLALHAGATGLRDLFEAGNLSFIANMGSLVRPTTLADFNNNYSLPYGIYSHSDQAEQWQTSIPHSRSGFGWAGRIGDMLSSVNKTTPISMNISISGNNIWQVGNQVYPYTVSHEGARSLDGYGTANDYQWIRKNAIDNMLSQEYAHILDNTFSKNKKGSIEAYDLYSAATSQPMPADNLGTDRLGQSLREIAKIINGRSLMGVKRQIFFVQWGGWDFHDEVLGNMNEMIPAVSDAMKAFYDLLVAMGVQNNVTLFSASEFGRTLTSNNRGSDHAWGGHQWVMGGAVNGKRIFGQYPDLYLGSTLDIGRGAMIPTTSVDQHAAELALWFGVAKSDLQLILPNIGNFYDVNSSGKPLGFMV